MVKMKLAVCTRADRNIQEMTDISHPHIKAKCREWGADFIVMDHDSGIKAHPYHYRIVAMREILQDYDRAVSIDSDMLVLPRCPNPFERVPDDQIGSVYEDKGTRQKHRRKLIAAAQARWGDVGWTKGYVNSGFMVFSRQHADVFEPVQGQWWDKWGFDDVHLGYQIHAKGHQVRELHWKWNHMTMFSEKFNNCANRFNSFIIHYAGIGTFDAKNRLLQMRKDRDKIHKGML